MVGGAEDIVSPLPGARSRRKFLRSAGCARKHNAMALAQAFAPLIDLIYPPRCPLCGEGLAAQSGLCSSCWSELVIPGEPCCSLCQRPFGEGQVEQGAICAPCMAEPPKHDGIAAGTLYNEAARKLVLGFKHGGKIAHAPLLAGLIMARLPEMDDDWAIVPVPLHRQRLWHRGYNQAALLAGQIARRTGARLIVDGLQRRKATPSLGGLGKKARKRALSGAIAVNVRRSAELQGRNILLVDDVLTSGATSSACVSALKRAGAEKVVIACASRVLHEATPLDSGG